MIKMNELEQWVEAEIMRLLVGPAPTTVCDQLQMGQTVYDKVCHGVENVGEENTAECIVFKKIICCLWFSCSFVVF